MYKRCVSDTVSSFFILIFAVKIRNCNATVIGPKSIFLSEIDHTHLKVYFICFYILTVYSFKTNIPTVYLIVAFHFGTRNRAHTSSKQFSICFSTIALASSKTSKRACIPHVVVATPYVL